ncbi:hypothetical protein CERZMDRAFT_102775 [Cercospora zeae-maydis SCOH1-5]|uniref:BTB domain-containing protein n=1 Tax=Cercospora zeae-maydis SCOH1-5 TaxID=717836 RepID=A0A6A6F412_9PEZI|nr:hypothetical protein CERZMDRAFT_102775 [Cercospora zeae-maydis SCOH1-5]
MAERSRVVEDTAGLKATVRSVYQSSLYSDFTIRCGAAIFRVHKLVLHAYSAYFRRLFTNTIAIPEVHISEDPRVFSVLIRHIYQLGFTCKPPPDMSLQTYCIKVFAMAEKYELMTLRVLAAERLQQSVCSPKGDLQIMPRFFVEILYTMDKEGGAQGGLLWSLLIATIEDNGKVLIEDKQAGFEQACFAIPNLNRELLPRLASLYSRRRQQN